MANDTATTGNSYGLDSQYAEDIQRASLTTNPIDWRRRFDLALTMEAWAAEITEAAWAARAETRGNAEVAEAWADAEAEAWARASGEVAVAWWGLRRAQYGEAL